tara:strand:- start:1202 stop:1366 length:165 start_codon:yes stop_codon:yes gene_type:complete
MESPSRQQVLDVYDKKEIEVSLNLVADEVQHNLKIKRNLSTKGSSVFLGAVMDS